jgi:pSer/pThr/pTyr-binding forkhead associated (FHA) protein
MNETWICLIKIKGKGGWRSHLIEKPSFTIGRTQEADLPIVEPSVSRVHLVAQITPEGITITDQKSANGTTVNGKPLQAGNSFQAFPGDVIRLGSSTDEFFFQVIPKPFEFSSMDEQRSALGASMEAMTRELNGKAKLMIEKGLQQAKNEIEQVRLKARIETDAFKAKLTAETQEKEASLLAEVEHLRQEIQSGAEQAKHEARIEADNLIAQAQIRIQNDYEESGKRIEAQLKQAKNRALEIVAEGDRQANKVLTEAREEASQVRLRASEDARNLSQEALRKVAEIETEMQDKIQREMAEKKKEAYEQLKAEGERERGRIAKEVAAEKEVAQQQLEVVEAKKKQLLSELDRLQAEREKSDMDFEAMQGELVTAKRLIADIAQLESRKAQLEKDVSEAQKNKENALSRFEAELNNAKRDSTVDFENRRAALEEDLAKRRLAGLSEIESVIRAEEKKYEQTRRLRATDLSVKLYERMVPNLEAWFADPSSAVTRLKADIEAAVTDVVVSGVTSIQAVTGPLAAAPTLRLEKRDKKIRKNLTWAGASAIAIAAIFHTEIYNYFKVGDKDSYAAKLIERRRIQSIYNPEQNTEFRASYTDNVIFMSGYVDFKTDEDCSKKWALHLNQNLGLLRSMGLSEDNLVQYIGKEVTLVKKLGELRLSIDAVYLNDGIERMRRTEEEYLQDIDKVVKGRANLQRFRELEKEFISENTPRQKCKS